MRKSELTHVSLFAGIGGIDLAAEWAGFTTIAQVEKDDYCQRVLAKHWPDVHRVGDIRDFPDRDYGAVTLVSGGFPCQPHSLAGKKRRENDDRFLWPQMFRIIIAINPTWVLVENVLGAISDGTAKEIMDGLENTSYQSIAISTQAYAYGADFSGARLFLVAASNSVNGQKRMGVFENRAGALSEENGNMAIGEIRIQTAPGNIRGGHGVPYYMDRVRALGNAVVPQQVYPILKVIAEMERE